MAQTTSTTPQFTAIAQTTSTTPQFTASHSGLTQLTASEH